MTEKQLLQTLQTVDSKYTAEVKERIAQAQASGKRSRRIGMKPIILTAGAAAACLCVSMAALMPKDPDMTVANSDIKEQIALEEPETEQEPAEAAAVTTALATTAGKDSTAKTTAAVTQKNAKSSSAAQTKASGAANASKTTGTTGKNTKNTKQESAAKNTGSTASKTTGNAGGQLNVIPTADKSTTVTLPDFTGMSFAEAQKLAKSLRISLKATECVSPKAKGTVLEQLTFAGRKVSVNTEFEVYTATGGNEVTLKWNIPADKQNMLDDFEIILYDSSNQVYDMHNTNRLLLELDPDDLTYGMHFGKPVNPATISDHVVKMNLTGTGTVDVTAVIAHGENYSFPETLDLSKLTDCAVIGKYHIDYDKKKITTVSEDFASAISKVSRTEKPADIYEIPDFTGMTFEEAKRAARKLDKSLSLFEKEVASDKPVGTVVAQDIAAGTEASTKPSMKNKVIELSVSVGQKKEITFSVPHEIYWHKYPFMNTNPYLSDNYTYIPDPLSSLDVVLYELDENGKRTGEKETAWGICGLETHFFGAGVKNYEAVMVNNLTNEQAALGTYRIDFSKQTCSLISGSIDNAFAAVTSPLPALTNHTWEEAQALAAQAGINLIKIDVNNALPAGMVCYQPFDAGERISKGNTIPVEVSDGFGTPQLLCFEIPVPTGYTGKYSVFGYSDDLPDGSYDLLFEEFDAAQTNGTITLKVSGCSRGTFKLFLATEDSMGTPIGEVSLDFENQTAEMISIDFETAFAALNAK